MNSPKVSVVTITYGHEKYITDTPDLLFGKFPILKSIEEAKVHFKETSNKFVVGLGNPTLRKKYPKNFYHSVEFYILSK